jgi:outer membrane protein assembly factor BamB
MRGDLIAVRLAGAAGRLSDSAIVWKVSQGTADSSSPVLWDNRLFWVSDNGIAHCVDAGSGEVKWKERLPGDYKASPVAAEGRIYFLNLAGLCTVVRATDHFEKLAENQISDEAIASPALSDGRIFLRGRKALYCIVPHAR